MPCRGVVSWSASVMAEKRADADDSSMTLSPAAQHLLGARSLDLLAVAPVIDLEQSVMPFVGRAADRVAHHDDAVAEIDGSEHGRQHADVGLRAGDDQPVGAAVAQMRGKRRLGE